MGRFFVRFLHPQMRIDPFPTLRSCGSNHQCIGMVELTVLNRDARSALGEDSVVQRQRFKSNISNP